MGWKTKGPKRSKKPKRNDWKSKTKPKSQSWKE